MHASQLSCVLALAGLIGVSGCIDRPVTPAQPNTQNVVLEPLRQERIERIDLLFMLDNSISMADKQRMLADAVPQLVRRLVQPRCVDAKGNVVGGKFPSCPEGSAAEFDPVTDIHVGVVTSSLGSHGGNVCPGETSNDKAHLLPHMRPNDGLPDDGNGFLWWHPEQGFDDAAVQTFSDRFELHVEAANENGCGFEASLESWFRFLVDPSPPAAVEQKGGATVAVGIDEALLAQRRDFLRPDSLVAIVMLSDENDCSVRDSDVGWYVSTTTDGSNPYLLARPTSTCATDPDSPCCRSCISQEPNGPPAGCVPVCEDSACQPECQSGQPPLHSADEDRPGLRCFRQKQRFGIDFLYPTTRYVNALAKTRLCRSRADLDPELCAPEDLVPNPLYDPGEGRLEQRTPDLVFLAGIVGVPWQDTATPETLGDPARLDYLSAEQLTHAGRWAWLTGERQTPPLDPLMRESVDPRSGEHPSGDPALAPAPPEAPAGANAANGHEWRPRDQGAGNPLYLGDLQYACSYALAETVDCHGVASCDCSSAGQSGYSQNKPLCQAPGSAAGSGYSELQHFAKAYPGTRQLEVLRDYGKNSIVASICPKVLDPSADDYGYNPAVDAIVDRLGELLGGKCLPRPLAVTAGEVPCKVVEATIPEGGACACDAAGRQPIASALDAPARRELEELGICGPDSPSGVACSAMCLCEALPYQGDALAECQSAAQFTATDGWCYVDPDKGYPADSPGAQALVARCPAHERRLLRFEPASGAVALIACQGAAYE